MDILKGIGSKLFQSFFWFVLVALAASVIYGASGDLDPTFNASAFGNFNGNVNVIRIQPDGKF